LSPIPFNPQEKNLVIKVQIEANSITELMAQMQRLLDGQGWRETAAAPEPEPMTPPPAEAAPEPSEGNGQDEPEPAPKTRRARKPPLAVVEPDSGKAPDLNRDDIVKGLTDVYMTSPPAVRARITQFRDAAGANRLRDLDDGVLPEAAKLLAELKQAPAAS
jgi:hypothetical protein